MVLPFPDAHFDTVVSNYVFEHVEDLAATLNEIHRVLRPGGKLIALFPTVGAWREGHLNLPFVHWLPPGKIRYVYTLGLRRLGFGERGKMKTPEAWSKDKLRFLDTCTFYRSRREMRALLKPGFCLRSIEDEFVAFRLGDGGWMGRLATASGIRHGTRLIAQLAAVTAIEATRAPNRHKQPDASTRKR